MSVNVCHISTVHKLYDDRILYKQCMSLADSGYNVYYLVRNNCDEKVNNVNVIALREYSSRISRFINGSIDTLKKAFKTRSKVFHLHDPELIIVGLILKLLGRKVIFDIHELVYHQIEDKQWLGNRFFRKIIKRVYLIFEYMAINLFDSIIIAEDGYRSYFEARYPRMMHKINAIRNYCILSLIDSAQDIEVEEDVPIVMYVGGLSRIRGIKETVQAMEHLNGKALLYLLGPWSSDEYYEECKNEKGWTYVRYLGFKKLEEVYSYLKCADVCLGTVYPVKNHMTSLFVKFFEYMALEKPMLISDFPYWREHFSECAEFTDPQDPSCIASKISELVDSPKRAAKMGECGRNLVNEKKYYWENEKKYLFEVYDKVLNENS